MERDFVARVVPVIRNEARRMIDSGEGMEELAALTYAVGSVLAREFHPVIHASAGESLTATSLGSALGQAATLPSNAQPSSLFWVLYGLLQRLDERHGVAGKSARTSLRRAVSLNRFGLDDLRGNVVLWPASRLSTLRRLRERRGRLGKRKPPRLIPHPADVLNHLGLAWNADPRRPSIMPAPKRPKGWLPLLDQATPEGFRVALCPLPGQCHPVFRLLESDALYRTFVALERDAIIERPVLEDHIRLLLAEAARQEIHLVVMPELMVDEALRGVIATALSSLPGEFPMGVVAGSFHVWRQGEDPLCCPTRNESALFAKHHADALLLHHKRGRFRVLPDEVAEPWFQAPTPLPNKKKLAEEIVELVTADTDIHVLETSLGRIMILICTDCITHDPSCLEPEVEELKPDLVVIVSMTPETQPFLAAMDRLSKSGVSSVFANAYCVARTKKKARPLLATAHLALWEPKTAPPVRAAWFLDDAEPAVRYWEKDDEGWTPLSKNPHPDSGLSMLLVDNEPAALVLDFGAHERWVEVDRPDQEE